MNKSQNKLAIKKYKFNAVDTAVIVIICLAIISLALILDPFDWIDEIFNTKEVTISYVIEFKALDDSVVNDMRLNDIVVGKNNDTRVASMISIEKQIAYEWVPDHEKGLMEKKELKDKKNVFVTLEVDCVYKEGEGYFIGSQRIAVGSKIEIDFPGLKQNLTGYCVSLEEIK